MDSLNQKSQLEREIHDGTAGEQNYDEEIVLENENTKDNFVNFEDDENKKENKK